VDVSRRSFVSAGVGAGIFAALGRSPDEVSFWAVDLFSGRGTTHLADDARPVLTLSAGLALGLLLSEHGASALAGQVRYAAADVVRSSPVCSWHVQHGLSVEQLGDAALRRADATATNLLVARAGGTAAVTGFCRRLGDRRTRIDRSAPDSCTGAPWDPQDTTTTAALARSFGALLVGHALTPTAQARLVTLFPTTGLRDGWSLSHAFASGRYGTAGLVGTARRGRRRVLLAATVRAGQPAVFGSRSAVTQVVTAVLDQLDRSW
jgi:beta-lactamase class A